MQRKIVSLVSVFLVVVLCQSCATQENSLKAEAPHPGTLNSEVKPSAGVSSEVPIAAVPGVKVGDNLAAKFSKIKVKDSKLKAKTLSSVASNKNTLLVMVKPGCIFCESLLAVMDTVKPNIKPQVVFVLDAEHATEQDFKQKQAAHSKVKGIWIYDYENKFHEDLGMTSYPRLLYVNSKQVVVQSQVGLVLPTDPKAQEQLKKEQFPVVLQKLSQSTIAWMESL